MAICSVNVHKVMLDILTVPHSESFNKGCHYKLAFSNQHKPNRVWGQSILISWISPFFPLHHSFDIMSNDCLISDAPLSTVMAGVFTITSVPVTPMELDDEAEWWQPATVLSSALASWGRNMIRGDSARAARLNCLR